MNGYQKIFDENKNLIIFLFFGVIIAKLFLIKFSLDYFVAFPSYLKECLIDSKAIKIFDQLGSDGGYYYLTVENFFKKSECDIFLGYFYNRIIPILSIKLLTFIPFVNISSSQFLLNLFLAISLILLLNKIFFFENNINKFLIIFLTIFNFGFLSIFKFDLINYYPFFFISLFFIYYEKKLSFLLLLTSILSFNYFLIYTPAFFLLVKNKKKYLYDLTIVLIAYLLISLSINHFLIDKSFNNQSILSLDLFKDIYSKSISEILENYYQIIFYFLEIIFINYAIFKEEQKIKYSLFALGIININLIVLLFIGNFEWGYAVFHFNRISIFTIPFLVYLLIKIRKFQFIKYFFLLTNFILSIGSIIWFIFIF